MSRKSVIRVYDCGCLDGPESLEPCHKGLPLQEISCSSPDNLVRLYERIRSARGRV